VFDGVSLPIGDDSGEEVGGQEHEKQSVGDCMEENTIEDQEGCTAGVDACSECKLEITDAEEVRFYAQVYKLAVDLTELYASPEQTENATKLANWLTTASDGIVLGCTGSTGAVSYTDTKMMTSVRVNCSDNPELTDINSDLHITESFMNSSYVSEDMCEFRGKMLALLIKLVLIRRLNPCLVSGIVDQFQRRVTEFTKASCIMLRTRTAGLKPVSGSLCLDSFATLPGLVRSHCKNALIESLNNGASIFALQDLCCKRAAQLTPPKKREKCKEVTSLSSDIGPRVVKKNSLFCFVGGTGAYET